MERKINIKEFCEVVFKTNAPLSFDLQTLNNDSELYDEIKSKIKNTSLLYPYKPFFILSILHAYNDENIFNKKIDVGNLLIVKKFYDFITSDYFLFSIIKGQKSKQDWGINLGLNNHAYSQNLPIYKSVLSIIKQSPLKAMSKNKFINKIDNNHFSMEVEITNWDKEKQYLISMCYKNVKKCIPWFSNLTENEIDNNFENEYLDIMTLTKQSEIKVRKFQHVFRKSVFDRDIKCNICCIDNANILDACHIKPYSVCEQIEAYDENNGIILCKNHHKLFDLGLFTFDNLWKVKISKHLTDVDSNLFFKQYEPCHINLANKLVCQNKFVQYHNKMIFKK